MLIVLFFEQNYK